MQAEGEVLGLLLEPVVALPVLALEGARFGEEGKVRVEALACGSACECLVELLRGGTQGVLHVVMHGVHAPRVGLDVVGRTGHAFVEMDHAAARSLLRFQVIEVSVALPCRDGRRDARHRLLDVVSVRGALVQGLRDQCDGICVAGGPRDHG